MLKRALSFMLVSALFIVLLTGCGKKSANYSYDMKNQDVADDSMEAAGNKSVEVSEDETAVSDENEATTTASGSVSITGTGNGLESANNAILAQRKMIRNANITIEVKDFDVAYGKIETLISGIGIVQETNISREKAYYDDDEKLITKGIIVIRVDKDRFDKVLSGLKGLGLVTDQRVTTEDVTDKFFDTESRLRLLKYEESRLLEYLKKISDPDTIFKTESRLTEIRHEIEGLTGTLQKMNDLVKLSTITINISEVLPETRKEAPKTKSLWDKLSDGFVDSFKGVTNFCAGFLIFTAQSLPVIAFLALIALLGWICYKKLLAVRKRYASKDKIEENDENE